MEMIAACVLSFAVTVLLGWRVILPALRRLKAGQEIREVGPQWHKTKAGTPTMGGLMFIAGIGASILAVGWRGMLEGDFSLVEDERWGSLQSNYEDSLEEGDGRCGWSYFLMDFNQDGVKELVVRLYREGVNNTASTRGKSPSSIAL